MTSLLQKISSKRTKTQRNEQDDERIGKATSSEESLINEIDNGDNKSEASYGSTNSNPSPCGQCNKLVKEEDPAMKCEICEQWYHIKCQNITKAEYNYIQGRTKKKSLNKMHWYCLTCDRMAVNIMKTMTILHVKQQKIEEEMAKLENKINQKVDKEDIQKLKEDISSIKDGQRKVLEDQNKKIKEIIETKQNSTSWADIVSKEEVNRNVNDTIDKRLKEKEEEEKARRDRMKNIIIYGINELQDTNPLERRTNDIKEIQNLLKNYCEVELQDEDIGKSMRLGKYDQTKKRPILIAIKTEDKKREIFQNLHKLRRSSNNISVSHDLTRKQREELQELIKEARKKEESDQSGNVIYRVRGPPWNWFIKKINKKDALRTTASKASIGMDQY